MARCQYACPCWWVVILESHHIILCDIQIFSSVIFFAKIFLSKTKQPYCHWISLMPDPCFIGCALSEYVNAYKYVSYKRFGFKTKAALKECRSTIWQFTTFHNHHVSHIDDHCYLWFIPSFTTSPCRLSSQQIEALFHWRSRGTKTERSRAVYRDAAYMSSLTIIDHHSSSTITTHQPSLATTTWNGL